MIRIKTGKYIEKKLYKIIMYTWRQCALSSSRIYARAHMCECARDNE
jgi:hypothetical protein